MPISTHRAPLATREKSLAKRIRLIVSLMAGCLIASGCQVPQGLMQGLQGLGAQGPQAPQAPQLPQAPGGASGAAPAPVGPSLLGIGGNPGGSIQSGGQAPGGTPGTTIPGGTAGPLAPSGTTPPGGTVVCIDPGHPSETSNGTQAADGTTEITVAWRTALKMQALLQAQGLTVVLTKSAERQMVTNRERAEIANRAGAAICVRLHCDASSGTGYALYAPDRQGTTAGVTGPTQDVIRSSNAAAKLMLPQMQRVLNGTLVTGGVRGDSQTAVGSRQGALTGSIFSQVPIITVEMCVLTNRTDAALMVTDQGQNQMARALVAGILAAIGRSPSI